LIRELAARLAAAESVLRAAAELVAETAHVPDADCGSSRLVSLRYYLRHFDPTLLEEE